MILMIVSLLLVLCAFFVMCLLSMGKRAGHKMELLLIDSLDDLQEVHTFCALPQRTKDRITNMGIPATQQEPIVIQCFHDPNMHDQLRIAQVSG